MSNLSIGADWTMRWAQYIGHMNRRNVFARHDARPRRRFMFGALVAGAAVIAATAMTASWKRPHELVRISLSNI
jgi:hypothetical protein